MNTLHYEEYDTSAMGGILGHVRFVKEAARAGLPIIPTPMDEAYLEFRAGRRKNVQKTGRVSFCDEQGKVSSSVHSLQIGNT